MNKSGLITFCPLHVLITWGAFSILPAMFAANGPPPITVSQPVDVVVKNTAAAAVQVEDINNPAFQPFSFRATRDINLGNVAASAAFTVPNGKRLVIEFVSFGYILPPGQTPRFTAITIHNPVTNIISEFLFFMNRQSSTLTEDVFVGTSPTRLYASAGETVTLVFERAVSTASGQGRVSISGYYVNVP
jgi:hypothetical protein